MVGNHSQSVKAQGSLTVRLTSRAGTKVGLSDPVVPHGRAIAQRIKAGYDTTIPMVITNSKNYHVIKAVKEGPVNVGDELLDLK